MEIVLQIDSQAFCRCRRKYSVFSRKRPADSSLVAGIPKVPVRGPRVPLHAVCLFPRYSIRVFALANLTCSRTSTSLNVHPLSKKAVISPFKGNQPCLVR